MYDNFFFEFSSRALLLSKLFVGILTPSRTSGVCGPAFTPYHLGNTLDAMATCFFLSQSLLSVSNSPLQTQLTNPALISCMRCVFLFVTRRTDRVSLVTSVESNKRQVKERLIREMTKLQCDVVKMYTKKCPLFHIEWIQRKFTFRFSH